MNSSAVLARGLAAKEHASAKDKRADHRRVNVEMAATFGECFAPCKLSDEVAASAPQRPPTSIARNASLQRLDLHSSGYVRSLARFAASSAAPVVRPPPGQR